MPFLILRTHLQFLSLIFPLNWRGRDYRHVGFGKEGKDLFGGSESQLADLLIGRALPIEETRPQDKHRWV